VSYEIIRDDPRSGVCEVGRHGNCTVSYNGITTIIIIIYDLMWVATNQRPCADGEVGALGGGPFVVKSDEDSYFGVSAAAVVVVYIITAAEGRILLLLLLLLGQERRIKLSRRSSRAIGDRDRRVYLRRRSPFDFMESNYIVIIIFHSA